MSGRDGAIDCCSPNSTLYLLRRLLAEEHDAIQALIGSCLVLLAMHHGAYAALVGLKPVRLTVDLRANPIGIGSRPVFAWNLQSVLRDARNQRQVGYRLRIASTEANLTQSSTVLWDSGRIDSSTYWQRLYSGPPLESATVYFWQVQVWS